MNDLVTQQPAQDPFGRMAAQAGGLNVGSVAVESERAIAEARGQIQVAQMFPRDVAAARAELLAECDVYEFAAVASYAVPRAGGVVTGPSIRLAEAVASAYGHMEWGHRELSRGDGKSEVEVYAWDKQKNNRRIRQITVDHFRDTKNGPVRLRDSKDIDDKIANVASKQMRGAILALVPKSFTEAAIARCKQTLAGGGGVPLKQRVEKMVDAFAKLGVTAELLKKYLKHPLDSTNGDEIAELTAIYNAIKGGDKIADHFPTEDEQASAAVETGSAITNRAKANAAAAPKPTKAPAPAAAAVTQKEEPAPAEKVEKSNPAEAAAKPAQEKPAESSENAAAAAPAKAHSAPPPADAQGGNDDVF